MKGTKPVDNGEIRSVSTCFTGFSAFGLSGSFKFLDGEFKQIADEKSFFRISTPRVRLS